MEIIENSPQIGVCGYCGRLSVRLLNAPVLKIPMRETRPYERNDYFVWWKSCVAPASLYRIVAIEDDYLICYDDEVVQNRKYCFRCFDGNLSPSERDYCLNIPREMHFIPHHPWWPAKWISAGRELLRHKQATKECSMIP